MVVCIIIGCANRTGQSKVKKRILPTKVSFHRIPNDEKRRAQWMSKIKDISKNGLSICSDHFLESCFKRVHNKVFLHEDAVPTIFTCCPEYLKVKIVPQGTAFLKLFDDIPDVVCKSSNSSELNPIEDIVSAHVIKQSSISKSECISRSISSLPVREPAHSPVKEILIQQLHSTKKYYSKKIRILQQKIRRRDQKIAHFSAVFKALKKEHLL